MRYTIDSKNFLKSFYARNVFIRWLSICSLLFIGCLIAVEFSLGHFKFAFVICMIFLIPLLILALNNGWKIENDCFHLKTCLLAHKVKISSMEVGLVAGNDHWIPYLRRWAIRLPSLLSGNMFLKNGKKATAFHHLDSKFRLLIYANKRLYSISHPGVEELYDKLLSLGAKEKNFE